MAQFFASLGMVVLSLLLAPLLPGVINRVKAKVGGRRGRPLLQLYYDLVKLMRKGAVYAHCTSWIFKAAGPAGVAAGVLALCLVPFGALLPLISFTGDFVLLAGIFSLARYALILAALDTGSAFEGMGAAREALFSGLAEPIFLFSLLILGLQSPHFSLAGMLGNIDSGIWQANWSFYLMLSFALFLLLLTENCRIPVDDPNTHLELTMIHEVMILDHSGPDLALLEFASALKLWIFSLLIAGLLLPAAGWRFFSGQGAEQGARGQEPLTILASVLLTLVIVFLVAALIGLVESLMARLRMERVPQVLTLSGSFTCLAALSLWR